MAYGFSRRAFLTGSLGLGALGVLAACGQAAPPTPQVVEKTVEKVVIDDEKGVAAMTFLKQLWDTKAALDTDWLKPPYWGALKAGKLATDYMPAWMRGFVRDETKSPDQGLGQWRVTLLPAVAGGEGGSSQIGRPRPSPTQVPHNP